MDGLSGRGAGSGYTLRALGTLEVLDPAGDQVPSLMAQPRRLLLLTYMVHSARALSRSALVRLFWPESEEKPARNALRQALHFLAHELGHSVIRGHGTQIVSVPPGTVDYDAHALLDTRLEASLSILRLYRGPFVDGVEAHTSHDLQNWIDGERERARRRARDVAMTLAESAARKGRLADAARLADRAVGIAPLDERARTLHIHLLHRCGHHADALREIERFRNALAEELDLTPSPEFERFVARLRGSARPSASAGRITPS